MEYRLVLEWLAPSLAPSRDPDGGPGSRRTHATFRADAVQACLLSGLRAFPVRRLRRGRGARAATVWRGCGNEQPATGAAMRTFFRIFPGARA